MQPNFAALEQKQKQRKKITTAQLLLKKHAMKNLSKGKAERDNIFSQLQREAEWKSYVYQINLATQN